jgi:ubiquinone/menaquinone biosynthesis C-methylase UbiE
MAARATSDTARLYDRIAPAFHRWWEPVIEPASLRLLDLVAAALDDRPGAVVVDLGAGSGPLARAAVSRWPDIETVAIDPSAGMLDIGRAEAARSLDPEARRRIRWQPGVAEHLPIADRSVDAVVSSFTLQYLPNRAAALREARRVLRPGGALGVVTWLTDGGSFPPWRALAEVLAQLGIERPPSPETGMFRSLPSAAALVRRAGFRHVHATRADVEYQWTVDAFLSCAFESEERELVDRLDPATRAQLERLWRARLERLTDADLRYRDPVAYVTGRRPAP